MARITVEDCLKRVENRFLLVHMAAKRVRQIREGSEYLVSSPKNEDIVVALREIAAGKVILKKDVKAEIEALEEKAKERVEKKTKKVLETAEETETKPEKVETKPEETETKAEEVETKPEEVDEKPKEADEDGSA